MIERGPWRITFDTNPDDCNLSCIMCERFSKYAPKVSGKPRRMNFRIIRRVISEAAQLGLREIIPSTMGEPLLYRNFKNIVDLCHEYHLSLNVTTNGTWPRMSPSQWAEVICPVTSDVKISWNGATAETQEAIMVGSKFDRHLDDLIAFISARDELYRNGENRCNITLQCTFMERNLSEIPDIIKLASKLGIDRVKGHHIWVHTSEMESDNLRRNKKSRQRWNSTVRECWQVASEYPRNNGVAVKLDNFTLLPLVDQDVLQASWICPFLGKEAWINAEGRFDPCCAPDIERKILGYFGHVKEPGSLEAIWTSKKYLTLTKKYMNNEVCQKCTMRGPKKESP